MDSLIFSLNATIPVFLVIVLGYILMRVGFFTEGFVKIADKYVFKVALPVLLFKQIATADIHSDFDIKFVLFCMISTTLMFAGVWLGARLFLKDKSSVGAFAQAAARGSAAILGIAFIENIYGSSGMGPLMIVSAVPLYNIYSVIILTLGASDRESGRGAIKKTLRGIITNPIIIGIVLGLPFSIAGITIPAIPVKNNDKHCTDRNAGCAPGGRCRLQRKAGTCENRSDLCCHIYQTHRPSAYIPSCGSRTRIQE